MLSVGRRGRAERPCLGQARSGGLARFTGVLTRACGGWGSPVVSRVGPEAADLACTRVDPVGWRQQLPRWQARRQLAPSRGITGGRWPYAGLLWRRTLIPWRITARRGIARWKRI